MFLLAHTIFPEYFKTEYQIKKKLKKIVLSILLIQQLESAQYALPPSFKNGETLSCGDCWAGVSVKPQSSKLMTERLNVHIREWSG